MIPIGKSDIPLSILPSMANRHGLIAGATGTGKTVTLRVLAEGFSRLGVPVFMADIKGDLSGLAQKGEVTPKLVQSPQLYATFLLWLLSELFEHLPEVGDPEKPKLVFFFDEAHLLFNDSPKILVDKIEQLVRLIRSKGVGIYFVTQNPLDLPETVLGQLGNRVQHALRAYTPKDQKAVKTAAQTFRPNPKIQVESAITELGVGEALVSVLDEKGVPTPVERAWIYPPQSRFQPLNPVEREESIKKSVLFGHYEKEIKRESAYEILNKRAAERQAVPQRTDPTPTYSRPAPPQYDPHPPERYYSYGHPGTRRASSSRQPQSMPEKIMGFMARSAASSIGSQIGRQLIRGLLGSILGGR